MADDSLEAAAWNGEEEEGEDPAPTLREVANAAAIGESEAACAALQRLTSWLTLGGSLGAAGPSATSTSAAERGAALGAGVRRELLGASASEWLAHLSARASTPEIADAAGVLLDALGEAERAGDEGGHASQLVSIPVGSTGSVVTIRLARARCHGGGEQPDWSMSSGREIWAGSRVLARLLLSGEVLVEGRRVLELGCGLGLVGLAAARAGAQRAVLTDRDAELLRAVEASAALTGIEVEVALLDWDRLDDGLAALPGGGVQAGAPEGWPVFDTLLGADIVYEEAHATALLEAVQHLLRRGVAAEAVLVTGSPASRDGVAALCRLLGVSEERFAECGHDAGTLSVPSGDDSEGDGGRGPSGLSWSVASVPGVQHGKPCRLYRLALASPAG